MTIPLIGPDGRKYEVDDERNLSELEKLGYRVETPDAPQSLGETVEAGARDVAGVLETGLEGAAQGVSGGLYGAALARKQGAQESPEAFARRQVEVQNFKQRREENPIASGVGEFAGMLASPINKVGAGVRGGLAAKTAIGRIGAAAAGEGVEGLLYGAGNTLSDAALGNQELTGEKLAAGIGLGGLLGLAGGGVGAGLGEGFKAVTGGVGKMLAKASDPLLEIRDLFGMKAAGAMGKDFRAAAYRDNTRELVDLLVEKGVMKAGGKVDDVAEAATKLAKDTGDRQGQLAAKLEQAGAVVDGGKVAADLDALAAKYAAGNVGDQAIATRLAKEAELLRTQGAIPFTKAEELKRGFDKYLEFGAEQSPLQEGLKRARGILNGEIEASAKKLALPEVDDWLKAKKEMGLLAQVRDFSVARAEGLKANNTFSLTDRLASGAGMVGGAVIGGYGTQSLEGAVTGAALGLGNKVLRERLPSLIAIAADKIAKSPKLMVAATSLGAQIQSAPELGKYAAPLLQAFAHSPASGLATHAAWMETNPDYAAAAQSAGFLPETPEEATHALTKATHLAAVAHALDKQNRDISSGLDAILKGTKSAKAATVTTQDFGAKRMRQDSEKAHRTRVDEIRELAGNPDALLERMTANLGETADLAPGVAVSMTQTAQRAVAYLAESSQEPPKAGPLAADWVPTEAERYEFAQKLEVVENPMSVLRFAAAGTLVPEQWRALSAVYPFLAQQIRDEALERMADPPANVPYKARLMLDIVTGIDPTGEFTATAANQQAIAAAAQKEQGQKAPKDGKLTLGQRTATKQQNRETVDAEA